MLEALALQPARAKDKHNTQRSVARSATIMNGCRLRQSIHSSRLCSARFTAIKRSVRASNQMFVPFAHQSPNPSVEADTQRRATIARFGTAVQPLRAPHLKR